MDRCKTLAARQELSSWMSIPGDERVGRKSYHRRARRSGCGRPAELHPAVLEQLGWGPAVKQLAASTACSVRHRHPTDIDYPIS